MEELEGPILTNKTISAYTLRVFLNKTTFNDTVLSVPLTFKEYLDQYKHDSEIFYLKERHDIDELDIVFANKNFFTILVEAWYSLEQYIGLKECTVPENIKLLQD